jgi:hypothetical protein
MLECLIGVLSYHPPNCLEDWCHLRKQLNSLCTSHQVSNRLLAGAETPSLIPLVHTLVQKQGLARLILYYVSPSLPRSACAFPFVQMVGEAGVYVS